MRPNELAEHIYEAAKECGFDNCGIISLDALDGYKRRGNTAKVCKKGTALSAGKQE